MTAVKDHLTTSLGLALGTANYAAGVGIGVPQNQDQWISFAITVLMYAFGLLVKR